MSKKKKLHLSDSACLNIGKILIDSSLPNDICVFDVGANEGLFARRVVDQWPIKKIDLHCFEPNPAAYAILAEKLVDASTFTLVEIGLSSQEGTGTLYHPEKKTVLGSLAHREVFDSKVKQWGDVKAHSVKLSTLDAYRRVTKIIQVDYLKIDTEGYELEVIKGLEEKIKIVNHIYFEHHYDNMIKKGYTFTDINKLLVKNHFEKIYKSKMPFRKTFEYIYQKNKSQ